MLDLLDARRNAPFTLEETGATFGVTRERARQLEGKALRRLREALKRLVGPSAGGGAVLRGLRGDV